jgi:hypothetical protein
MQGLQQRYTEYFNRVSFAKKQYEDTSFNYPLEQSV